MHLDGKNRKMSFNGKKLAKDEQMAEDLCS